MDRDLPVSVWDEWKITEKIGEGSFGKVYKAQRTEKGKTFYSAIKVITIPSSQSELNSIRSETSNDQSAREYFHTVMEECIQEVSTMEYFRGNSHVVSVEDYKVVEYLDAIGWDIFIRMEYLTSFLDYCAEKQITEEEVVQIGIDMCKALECCQQLNIIHRDIKPENIFVSRFGEFKLGDFGIARELEKTMGGMSKKGTYSYMAPEMYRGEKYDKRADIYSLGIVLYKLMNRNRLPFLNLEKQLITYRDKENALTRRMSGEMIPKPAEAGDALAEVIQKACAYDVTERFQDAQTFRKALEDIKYGKRISSVEKRREVVFAEKKNIQSRVAETAESPMELLRKAEEEDRKAEERRREELRRMSSAVANKKRKKQRMKNRFLLAAVIVMFAGVLALCSVFIGLLMERSQTETEEIHDFTHMLPDDGSIEDQSEFEASMQKISNQATEISNNLETETLSEIGTVEDGKIVYLDEEGRVMKVLVYPSLSEEGMYEEYYYWDNGSNEQELFFAYIWSSEDNAQLYYYVDGKLIRWIDENKRCHDNETDNSEYVERGERYWNNAQEMIEGMSPP